MCLEVWDDITLKSSQKRNTILIAESMQMEFPSADVEGISCARLGNIPRRKPAWTPRALSSASFTIFN